MRLLFYTPLLHSQAATLFIAVRALFFEVLSDCRIMPDDRLVGAGWEWQWPPQMRGYWVRDGPS